MARQHHELSLDGERASLVSEFSDIERAVDILLKRAVDTAVLLWCVRSEPDRYPAFCTKVSGENQSVTLREEILGSHQALIDTWVEQAETLAIDYLPPIEGESIGVRFKEMCDQKIGGIIAFQALKNVSMKVT